MKHLLPSIVTALTLMSGSSAQAQMRTYVISIGNNAAPIDSDAALMPLRYADDDAARVYEWAHTLTDEITLLSVLDAETQKRFPALPALARSPTLQALRATVAQIKQKIADATAHGDKTTVIFYMSGHGQRADKDRPASLALLDGPLTQAALYDEVLQELPATYVHVLIDACHAEAVVRPRDSGGISAPSVALPTDEMRRWLAANTLERFPNVGAVIASSAQQEAHEWTVYQGGVFTHELLSGLRGGADINGDQRIEYSELQAFLVAANRGVDDAHWRVQVLTRPPPINMRVPLVDLHHLRDVGWATGSVASLHHFFVEDSRGARLIDANVEPGRSVRFALPAAVDLCIHSLAGESWLRLSPGQDADLTALRYTPGSTVSRDATASSMQRGLFSMPYGPAYYFGFVDRAGDPAVAVQGPLVAASGPAGTVAHFWPAWGVVGAALVSSGVFAVLAVRAQRDWDSTSLQRTAADAHGRYDAARTGLFISIGAAVASAAVGIVVEMVAETDGNIPPQ